jgi:hypothetical protein
MHTQGDKGLDRGSGWLGATQDLDGALIVILLVATSNQVAAIAVSFRADPLA